MLYQIRDINGEDLALVETNEDMERVQLLWTGIWQNRAASYLSNDLIEMLCKEIEEKLFREAKRVYVEVITP